MRVHAVVLGLGHGAHALVVDGGAHRQFAVAAVGRVFQLGTDHFAGVVQHMLDIVRPEIVFAALGGAARINVVQHHALREQLGKGLVDLHQPEITHDLGPKPRVQQVQDGVLNPANVLVHATAASRVLGVAHPVLRALGHHRLGVSRVAVAHEVPRRIHKGVHGVGLAPRGLAADRAHHTGMKALVLVQRVARAIGDAVKRQHHRQVFFRHRHCTMLFAMDDGYRRAPITLAAHAPVAQTPSDFFLAQAFGLQQVGHFAHRVFEAQAVKLA